MSYTERLIEEFKRLSNKATEGRLRRKSISVRMAKLRRLVAMARKEAVPNAKWLTRLFSGRANRTPWRIRKAPYVTKALRDW